MEPSDQLHDRRRFLRLAAGFSTGALLAGCGGGGGGSTVAASDPIVVVPAPAPTPVAAIPVVPTHPLNLALTLAYLGAEFHGRAAGGAGLPAILTGGVGVPGLVAGARAATLADPEIAAFAAQLAADKQRHVTALRGELKDLAASRPAIDLSTASTGAFSIAAQGAGIVAGGASFDPYAGDTNFLLGAFLIENAVAAGYRTILEAAGPEAGNDQASAVVAEQLGDAIYHAGMIRSLLDEAADGDAAIGKALADAGTLFAVLDGTNTAGQSIPDAQGASSDILDADGRAIAFTRDRSQVLKRLYLTQRGVGGFLPMGANGVA